MYVKRVGPVIIFLTPEEEQERLKEEQRANEDAFLDTAVSYVTKYLIRRKNYDEERAKEIANICRKEAFDRVLKDEEKIKKSTRSIKFMIGKELLVIAEEKYSVHSYVDPD